MTTILIEKNTQISDSEQSVFHQPLQGIINETSKEFESTIKSFSLFNIIFLSVGLVELVLLIVFFTFLAQSALLAFTLSIVFLTFFSYFLLKMYVEAQKPLKFEKLRKCYSDECRRALGYQEDCPESYPLIANAYVRLFNFLKEREFKYYSLPDSLKPFESILIYASTLLHSQHVYQFKEMLLLASVEEHIKLVRCEPTSLAAHSSLANAYIMLSGLYLSPNSNEEGLFFSSKPKAWAQKKFQETAKKAIEEFKILNFYAPDDPWVHAQLACSYRDLNMPLEEIKEYEALARLCPDDRDALYKLGMRYFQQGLNSQGLRVYEQLKRLDPKRAQDLLYHYGIYTQENSKIGLSTETKSR